MADPQDRPDNTPDPAPEPPLSTPPPAPPADTAPPAPPAKEPEKPAKKAPAKAVKKAAPAKAAKKHAAAKKAVPKKTPAKKPPAKKAPAKKIAPVAPDTNGQIAAAAKDAAAHAKSTVEAASNPLPAQPGPSSSGRSLLPLAVALAISVLAVLLIRRLRRDDD